MREREPQGLGGASQARSITVGDETFRALALARIVEPAAKLDTVRVLGELTVGSPDRVTFTRYLKQVIARDHGG